MDYTPRLKKKYNDEIVSSLKGNYKSVMQVPKLVKIIINQGVGKGSSDKKLIDFAQKEITLISFEYGVGWLITTDGYQKIRFSEKLSENKISDFEILYTYLLENNKNPSIIDMRNKSGAALRYDKK